MSNLMDLRAFLLKLLKSDWDTLALPTVNLDLIGLIMLRHLDTILLQTVLAGTSSLLDLSVLCPGLHRQQCAPSLNAGEYPAVAAMTTGYVFRVENSAVVVWVRRVGRTGELTNVVVETGQPPYTISTWIGTGCHILAAFSTIFLSVFLVNFGDLWGVTVLSIFILVRLINTILIRRRCQTGWKGASEPGVKGDLLVLLSQDRWVRMQGLVDDLKVVTSGQWLRDMAFLEGSFSAFANLTTYLAVALVCNMSQMGQACFAFNLVFSAGLLAVKNGLTASLCMNGRTLRVQGPRKRYDRRLTLARELIKIHGRDDWARRTGLIVDLPEQNSAQTGEQIIV